LFYVDKSNACDVEQVITEPKEVEDKEFKEDKKALVPSHLRLHLDHSMLKLIIFKDNIWTKSGSVVRRCFFSPDHLILIFFRLKVNVKEIY
jgi:hypothetical protein